MVDTKLPPRWTQSPSLAEPSLPDRAKEVAREVVQEVGVRAFALTGEPLAKLMRRRVQADPYPFYAQMRARGPLWRGKRIPLYVATTHEAVYTIVRDSRFGTDNRVLPNYGSRRPPADDVLNEVPHDHEMLLRMDPPDHTRVRRLVSRAFTPRTVERLRPRVEELAHELLDRVGAGAKRRGGGHDRASGRMDLIGDFAVQLPILVICELLGVPTRDRERFRAWGDDVVRTLGLRQTARDERLAGRAGLELCAYFEALFDEHRARPGDTLVDALIAVEDAGDTLSHRELLATCFLLLLAGFETTVNLIGNGTRALMANREQLEALRAEPSLAQNAVEELLRYDSPVQFTSRNTLEPVEIFGERIWKGEQIALLLGSANNDPAVFDEPRRLDLRRENAHLHVAFSSGPHFCLGAALARLEGEVAFTALLSRFADLRPAGRAVRGTNELLRGYKRLPVAFS